MDGTLPSLLGLDWFSGLGLNISGIHATIPDTLGMFPSKFGDVFDSSLGKYKGNPISFDLDSRVASICLKPRRVPFALCSKVDLELDKLIAQGVLEAVDHLKCYPN